MGFWGKEDVQRKLATEASYGGMTIAEINQLANMSDYNALYDNAWMTLSETPYMDAASAAAFASDLTGTINDFVSSNEADVIRNNARAEYIDANPEATTQEIEAYANEQVQFQARLYAEDIVNPMLDEYGPALFDNRTISSVLNRAFGSDFVDSLRGSVGLKKLQLFAKR